MKTTLRAALTAVAVLAVVVVGINLIPRAGGGNGGTGVASPSRVVTPSQAVSPSPAVSRSQEPSPSHQAVRMTVSGSVEAGSALGFTAEVPAGWTLEPFGAYRGSSEPPAGIGLFVSLVDNTFKDPCLHVQRSPKVGPTAADAAAALGQIPNTTATAPIQMTFAGHAATYLELLIPASLPCPPNQFYLWQDSPNGDWWAQGLNETIRVWIFEVHGQRVVVASRSWPGTSDVAQAERQRILDSIVFDGAS